MAAAGFSAPPLGSAALGSPLTLHLRSHVIWGRYLSLSLAHEPLWGRDCVQTPASNPHLSAPRPRPQSEVIILHPRVPVFCSVTDSHGSNEEFLKAMADLALKASCKLIICPQIENRNDRWIQVGVRMDSGRDGGRPGRP